jgi:tripartite-type tricarboxylate transporter receptor subunit TctC
MTRPRALPRRSLLLTASVIALGILSFSPAAWSQRSIKVVVPFPPGGSADILARLLGEQVGKTNGVTVVTENRPGGGASIAYEAVARAAPDANTLVINGNSLVINPHLRKVNYDPLTSFEPVCYLVSSPQVYVVSTSPYRTLNDITAARKPANWPLRRSARTTQHIGSALRHLANINVTYVPYTGRAPAITALLGNHVSAALANYSEVVEQTGKLRARFALARADRAAAGSTFDHRGGVQDYDVEGSGRWPRQDAKGRHRPTRYLVQAAMQVSDVKPKLANLGLYPVGTCGDDFAAHIRKQFAEYGRIIREANIKGE